MEKINDKFVNFASILEDKTHDQALTTSSMPFIYPHLALMPDAHLGKGATVGSVIPTKAAIIPAAVGVDIGCGMMAVRTQYTADDLAGVDLKSVHAEISSNIPLSAGKYNTTEYASVSPRITQLYATDGRDTANELAQNWHMQLGTLGSGNHFIEISLDETDRVWLFLHSGSRGVGNKIATKHIKIARDLCENRYISLPDPDLAYLVESDKEFWDYIRDLRWAQKFALLNREEMMDRVVKVMESHVGPIERKQVINCHHNYTEQETHFGQKVWLSRKGAISAKAGEWGLIPGSMGDKSYVVKGLGNKMGLESSPHGAGRNHSRSAARKLFTRDDLDARMAGVEWGNSDAFLDEHPDAYKDIDVVMNDASELVEVVHTLRQIVNVKGD